MAGYDGPIDPGSADKLADAAATHDFHLPLGLLSNQHRRTLEPFLEHLMLPNIPLGRDATAAEVVWARTE